MHSAVRLQAMLRNFSALSTMPLLANVRSSITHQRLTNVHSRCRAFGRQWHSRPRALPGYPPFLHPQVRFAHQAPLSGCLIRLLVYGGHRRYDISGFPKLLSHVPRVCGDCSDSWKVGPGPCSRLHLSAAGADGFKALGRETQAYPKNTAL